MAKQAEIQEQDDLFIKPTSDVFTNVLWASPGNEHFLLDFVNAVLVDADLPKIVSVEVLNPFNAKTFAVDKAIALDVRAKDECGRIIDIEIQIASHFAFVNRILYYWSNTYCTQLLRGDDYGRLNPVLSIVITEFPLLQGSASMHNVFEIVDRDDPTCRLTDHLQFHFIRLSEAIKGHWDRLDGLRTELRHWVEFFIFGATKTEEEMANIVGNDPVIGAAYQEFVRFKSDAELREIERTRQRALVDMQLMLGDAKSEGRAEGIAEGEAKGKAEGKADTIIKILSRLGSVPETLVDKINATTDLGKLDRLIDIALDCKSLDKFVKALN